mgnify:CR=1 FL=1
MSADQATIFTDDQSQTSATADGQTGTTTPATQTTSDIVSALVGEGKKYKTLDDLAKGYINADGFIEQLKAENRELKEKATAAKTVDDVILLCHYSNLQPLWEKDNKKKGSKIL